MALFVDGALNTCNIIDLHDCKDTKQRLEFMSLNIGRIIENLKPDHVVMEDVSLQTNASTLILLSRIQGAIIYACISENIKYTVYKPSVWRKILKFNQGKTVKRPELKKQAKDYVRNKYGISSTEDVCDAICIGEAFIKENNFKERE